MKDWHAVRTSAPPPVVHLSTRSVRPKAFVRPPLTDWGAEDFFERTMATVGTEDFNKLDDAIHLRRFHEQQRQAERLVLEGENDLRGEKDNDVDGVVEALMEGEWEAWEVRDREVVREDDMHALRVREAEGHFETKGDTDKEGVPEVEKEDNAEGPDRDGE